MIHDVSHDAQGYTHLPGKDTARRVDTAVGGALPPLPPSKQHTKTGRDKREAEGKKKAFSTTATRVICPGVSGLGLVSFSSP